MTAYAIAHVHSLDFGPEIVEYMQRIDATMEPFGGRFLVHAPRDVRAIENEWKGSVIVLEFPDMESLDGWWNSPEYQAILQLRTRHMDASIITVTGRPVGYRAVDALKAAE